MYLDKRESYGEEDYLKLNLNDEETWKILENMGPFDAVINMMCDNTTGVNLTIAENVYRIISNGYYYVPSKDEFMHAKDVLYYKKRYKLNFKYNYKDNFDFLWSVFVF